MSCHVMSCRVTSRHACHLTSRHDLSCHRLSCHVMSHHVMSCPVTSCRAKAMPCHATPCKLPQIFAILVVQLPCTVHYCSWLQEQGSIADVLQSDLAKIESLVEEAVRQLSSAASASSVRPLDACEVMEAMNRHHLNELLPRIQETDTAFEQLCSHCIDCKVNTPNPESTLHSYCSHAFCNMTYYPCGIQQFISVKICFCM